VQRKDNLSGWVLTWPDVLRNTTTTRQRAKGKGWVGRFLRGAVVAVIVSAVAVVVLSVFVLPPPELPPEPEETGDPKVIGGIEVSDAPAYTAPTETAASTSATGADATGAASEAQEAEAQAQEAEAQAQEAEAQDQPVELSGPAMVVNSERFEVDPSTPLVAVVLDETNSVPFMHEALFALGMPVTVGVVAGGGGYHEIAAAARAAGLEVLAELPLAQPGTASGGALEYGLPEAEAASRTTTLMRRLPGAVAATRPLASAAPPNATVLRGMLTALAPLGFAYVDHGVAPGEDSFALDVGPDAIVGVSRFAIPNGVNAAEAHSVLDRASAAAGRDGAAVVFAAPSEELILALQLWGGEGSANVATSSPLSAVILRQQGEALDQILGAEPVPEDPAQPPSDAADANDQPPPTNQ